MYPIHVQLWSGHLTPLHAEGRSAHS